MEWLDAREDDGRNYEPLPCAWGTFDGPPPDERFDCMECGELGGYERELEEIWLSVERGYHTRCLDRAGCLQRQGSQGRYLRLRLAS